ncbi:MAG: nucleoside phosphorylase [Clostridiales bacterium]|nr:nucleoside phosphorylase [Clostridiales bacterium]
MKQPHLLCDETDITQQAMIVGDPARVERVGKYLNKTTLIANNREFKLLKGWYKGQEITVVSTGIGAASAAIAIEELSACGVKKIIRVGSCGAYQEKVGLGELVVVTGAVREDGASKAYIPKTYPAVPDLSLTQRLIFLAEKNKIAFHQGIIRCHDSFYTSKEEEIMAFWNQAGVLGADMETAILFVLGRLKGIATASVLNNVVLYHQDVKQGIGDYASEEELTGKGEERAIVLALEGLLPTENTEG